jgi:CheY-like chemotaxis protein
MSVFEPGSHVLVVDDDPSVRTLIAMALADGGYSVVSAADGSEALALLRRRLLPSLDLILLDWHKPTPGWIFAEQYRLLPGLKAPIVVLTGQGDAVDAALAIHAQGFLRKPFDLDELLDIVHNLTHSSATPDALIH